MKLFKFHASTTDYLTLLVEAPNLEEARKIADESCGSEWEDLDGGDWNIDHDLTEEIPPSHVESPHYEAYCKRVAELEAEGLTTSDAQGVADVQFNNKPFNNKPND